MRAICNPPSSYKTMWRRDARVQMNRALRDCQDFDTLQIFKAEQYTCIYDWY